MMGVAGTRKGGDDDDDEDEESGRLLSCHAAERRNI